MNYSRKREAVLCALRNTTEHPTAEQLWDCVRKQQPDISLATVYRNLLQLEESGAIIQVGTVKGQARYDARLDAHGHFICRGCSSVSDVEYQEGAEPGHMGFTLPEGSCTDRFFTLFYGLCPACAGMQGEKPEN